MTVYFNADGTTTSKPKTTTTPTTLTPPPPAPTPRAAFNYADAYYAYPGYGESMKGIEAQQGGIEAKYGFTIRRDTSTTSPTRGGAYYKPKGAAEGTGTILATISPVDGSYVYKDAEGKVYTAADLEIDVVTLKPGDPGYIQGAFGATAATSDLNMNGNDITTSGDDLYVYNNTQNDIYLYTNDNGYVASGYVGVSLLSPSNTVQLETHSGSNTNPAVDSILA
jgi:hypothetical protein